MEIKDIINIAAIVLSPIIAVVVTIFLQNRSDKKKEKIAIIKSLLSTGHYLYSDEIIRSYNLIDIVFKDDKDVRAKWKLYYEALCNESLQYQVRLDKKLDLILAMCKSVNYRVNLLTGLCDKLEQEVAQATHYASQLMEAVLQEAFSIQETTKPAQVIECHPDQTTPETELLAAARGKIREDTWEHLCKRALEIAGEES